MAKISEYDVLQRRVSAVVDKSALAKLRGEIALESDADQDGGEFLRIVVQLKSLDHVTSADLQKLLLEIEDAVSEVDDRLPSVRFAEAA